MSRFSPKRTARKYDNAVANAKANPDITWPDEKPSPLLGEPSEKGHGNVAKRVVRHGLKFDSTGEANRHDVLLKWQKNGIIKDLEYKPKFTLLASFRHPSVGAVRARTWEADWSYTQCIAPHLEVVEDFKGYAYRSFLDKLPYILKTLQDRHVFINTDLLGWYAPHPERPLVPGKRSKA